MSERAWTEKQRQSIEARAGTVLVSAAAGSGKTAVLVERVIRRITDASRPVDVNRLLIVTYTRAAAAEMRQRLSAALAEKMAAEPENPLYQRQQMLLPQASISTVHGFCTALLREQAGRIGLSPRFRVAEESEAAIMANAALDELLEENYRKRDPAFCALAAQLGGRRSDNDIRQVIRQGYEFMQAQPFPERWLQAQLRAFTEVLPIEQTAWMRPVRQMLLFLSEFCLQHACRLEELAQTAGLEPYQTALTLDRQKLERLHGLSGDAPYETLYREWRSLSLERLAPVRAKDAAIEEAKEQVKARRKQMSDCIKKAQSLLVEDETAVRADLEALAPTVSALADLLTAYAARYRQIKQRKKVLDYNDLEHECLRLLLDDGDAPTPLAVELSSRFEEIMVDEYQDTNPAQDALFGALSRQGGNLFLVGDVKQSIYGFRQAMPALFTARRDTYTPFDPSAPRYPATVTLENNFRSRQTVTDTVNFVFRQLMHRSLGGVDYDEREQLVYSAPYAPQDGKETEFLLLDQSLGEGHVSAEVAEARAMAMRIRQMMAGDTVRDGEQQRPLQYRDICILLRSRKSGAVYAKELNRLGIPTDTDGGGTFFAAPEIMTVLSLLRVIDNPLREVEWTAVLLSPLYGFTPDEVAQLRLDYPHTPFITALEQASRATGALAVRCQRVLADWRRSRTLAVTLPADRLLERLYRDLEIVAVFSARAGGRQRVSNLHQLYTVAHDFVDADECGLAAFVRYVDRLEELGRDLPAGNTVHPDSVRILTIHGSKGLEFPVVFLARLSTLFNSEDTRQKILFHSQIGIGITRRDEEMQEKHRTFPFAGVLAARHLDSRAEEMRVLYVAMTRAKEKLCFVMTCKDLTATAKRLENALPAGGRELLPQSILQAGSMGEWLLMSLMRHPSCGFLRQDASMPSLAAQEDIRVTVINPDTLPQEETAQTAAAVAAPDTALAGTLRARAAYTYPYAPLARVPAKLAASELAHSAMQREHIATARPAFLQTDGLTAAQKGTALHTFMQFADFARASADPAAEADRLTAAGFLTDVQRRSLALDKVARFFADDLFARMSRSPDCRREFRFSVNIPADTLTDAENTGETVVVQGIADCLFRQDDSIVLVDYKTDRVRDDQELTDRYRSQLYLYKQALEQVLEMPVREALLYSFHLGRTVTVAL